MFEKDAGDRSRGAVTPQGEGLDSWSPPGLPNGSVQQEVAITLLTRPYEQALQPVLHCLGRRFGSARAWVLHLDGARRTIRLDDEWTATGPDPADVEGTPERPVTLPGELAGELGEGRIVAIADIEELPSSMRPWRGWMRARGVRHGLMVPVSTCNWFRGVLGLDWEDGGPGPSTKMWSPVSEIGRMLAVSLVVTERQGAWGAAPLRDVLYVQTANRSIAMSPDEIAAVSADGNYAIVHGIDGASYSDARPLKWWNEALPDAAFLRTHRAAIAHLHWVRELRRRPGSSAWEVELRSGHVVPVSRTMLRQLRRRLGLTGSFAAQ